MDERIEKFTGPHCDKVEGPQQLSTNKASHNQQGGMGQFK